LEGACNGIVDSNCEGIMNGSLERQSHCRYESWEMPLLSGML
jgi:hypothetical protein